MNKLIKQIRNSIETDVFTDTMLMNTLSITADSRYAMVKRAVKGGDIIRLKRGLYVFSKQYQKKGIDLFQCAQMICGPSYISLESSLAYHGWIPEAVYAVTSVSAKRSREVETPLGIFSYAHVPSNNFFAGVKRVKTANSVFLIATPWRALADYVYVHKLDWKGLSPVRESLRVGEDRLGRTDLRALEEIRSATQSARVSAFLGGVRKEMTK